MYEISTSTYTICGLKKKFESLLFVVGAALLFCITLRSRNLKQRKSPRPSRMWVGGQRNDVEQQKSPPETQ